MLTLHQATPQDRREGPRATPHCLLTVAHEQASLRTKSPPSVPSIRFHMIWDHWGQWQTLTACQWKCNFIMYQQILAQWKK